jgi:hypothetical protein
MNAITIFAAVASYVVIAILLLSLNVTSLWRWWVKGLAVVVVVGFFAGTYFAVVSLLGWPNPYGSPPIRFKLVWSSVVEPDRLTGGPGAVYLWVEEMDFNNAPSKIPRSFQLAYSDALATEVRAAQARRAEGEQIMGELHLASAADPFADFEAANRGEAAPEEEAVEALTITFQELPPLLTSAPAA